MSEEEKKIEDVAEKELAGLMKTCSERRVDWGTIAFIAFDTCNTSTSPVRNCEGGAALFHGVLGTCLQDLKVLENTEHAVAFRNSVRQKMPSMMKDNIQYWIDHFQKHSKGKREQEFMTDILPNAIGTNVRRDPALEIVRAKWDAANIGEWGRVRFPIIFHLQWDDKKNPITKKEKMFFHVTFHPWATCAFLAQALASSKPPIQIRETPFKDIHTKCMYQSPRKYVIDWDLYLEENLSGAGSMKTFTVDYLAKNMFVRALGVLHAYMRQMHVLPSKKELCVSIKSRTRKALNKHGKEDTKISLHATIHIMDPAEHHKKVIEACLRKVKKDCPAAYAAMTEKDSLKKGIHSVPELEAMGDYAGFMAMDTAMTNNWHQPIQSIGSSKGMFSCCSVNKWVSWMYTDTRNL